MLFDVNGPDDAKEILDTCGRCHYPHQWRYAIADDPLVSHHDIAISHNALPT